MKTEKQLIDEVENVLFCYKKYLIKIDKEIENLKDIVITHSTAPSEIPKSNYIEYKNDIDKKEDKREQIENSISRLEEVIHRIETALSFIEDEDYYCFIKMRYLDSMKMLDIYPKLGVDKSYIYPIRKKLLKALIFHFRMQKLIE